ncbi:MAG: hypothetical protein WAT23_12345 [Chromatiaceae bacterium]
MFENMFKGPKIAVMAHKVITILQRNYSLIMPENEVLEVLNRVPQSSNEHEMAVWYLSDWVGRIYLDHPKSKAEVTKYIRVAKQAQKNGFIKDSTCVNVLFKAIQARFGIDPATVSQVPY